MHARVTASNYVTQIGDRDACVERRGGEAAMAEQCLDMPQIGAAAQQMRRAGVAQRVGREPDTDASTVIVDAYAEACGAEARTVAREEGRRVEAGRELGPAVGGVETECS